MTDSTETKPILQDFAIDVCRTGFGVATIQVQAADVYAAQELALDQAGNHLYNEKSSEYDLVNPVPAPANPHEMLVTLEVTARDGESSVAGAQFEFNEASINRITRVAAMLKDEGLSEARYFAYPNQYFYKGRHQAGASLDAPEMVVAQSYIWFTGSSGDVDHDSQALDIPVLVNAFNSGVKLLIVDAGVPTFNQMEFLEETGQAVHDLDVGGSTMLIGLRGAMTAQDYAEYLDEEGEDTSPAER